MLPESFITQMKALLTDEFDAFLETYDAPTVRGLRLNKLKPSDIYADLPPVPWCANGRYYPETDRPAKSIYFNAGLYYIQEPSAMCPAEVLKPEPGRRVLDLCAAPGGKSVQMAGFLQGRGLLVSNDASPSRSRALVKNLEMAGVTNAIVTTEMPNRLAKRFVEFFDRILVDAPCSGEGMFRRDSDAVKAYTSNKPVACAEIQQEILREAAKMLKPGGRLVYSTCTFNTLENEGTIKDFLAKHPEFVLIPISHEELGISKGLDGLDEVGRIFPHRAKGEGHFVALLEKLVVPKKTKPAEQGTNKACEQARAKACEHRAKACEHRAEACEYRAKAGAPFTKKTNSQFLEFCKEHIIPSLDGYIVPHGVNLYLQPEPVDLSGLRVARSGWFLGETAKGRFVPSQALAMGLKKEDVKYAVELSENEAVKYLKGETLDCAAADLPSTKPWVMMCYKGYPLGWARFVQGRLKNNLPVGWAVS